MAAAQNFDALDVAGKKPREIELALERIADVGAVEKNQRVVAFGPAHAHLRRAARGAGAADGDAGHVAQHVGDEARLAFFEFFAVDDRDGGAEAVFGRGADAACGDDDFLDFVLGVRERHGKAKRD